MTLWKSLRRVEVIGHLVWDLKCRTEEGHRLWQIGEKCLWHTFPRCRAGWGQRSGTVSAWQRGERPAPTNVILLNYFIPTTFSSNFGLQNFISVVPRGELKKTTWFSPYVFTDVKWTLQLPRLEGDYGAHVITQVGHWSRGAGDISKATE